MGGEALLQCGSEPAHVSQTEGRNTIFFSFEESIDLGLMKDTSNAISNMINMRKMLNKTNTNIIVYLLFHLIISFEVH